MKKKGYIVLLSITASLICNILFNQLYSSYSNKNYQTIPFNHYSQFDIYAPYIINGPLWVGFDIEKGKWKYIKIKTKAKATELERGLVDPGNPSNWEQMSDETGYFNCPLSELPNGTHINNKYNPGTITFLYKLDDIMIKVGNFWVDKYESSLILVEKEEKYKYIDDPKFGGIDSTQGSKTGNAFDVPVNAIAVSQRRQGSTGLTYFVAEQVAINNGKHLIRNEQWQAAASGTKRTNANGMLANGENWKTVNVEDISRFGLVGCSGSLWEWTSSWGQFGEPYSGKATNWYDWPGPGSYAEWDDKFDTYGNDIIINLAGRAYTRQDSARYAANLPAALVRGGSWGDHNRAGIFALIADGAPSYYGKEVGFRCVK